MYRQKLELLKLEKRNENIRYNFELSLNQIKEINKDNISLTNISLIILTIQTSFGMTIFYNNILVNKYYFQLLTVFIFSLLLNLIGIYNLYKSDNINDIVIPNMKNIKYYQEDNSYKVEYKITYQVFNTLFYENINIIKNKLEYTNTGKRDLIFSTILYLLLVIVTLLTRIA